MKSESRKSVLVGLGLACLLLAAGAVWADPGANTLAKLDERVDMALKNAAPEEVFRTFAKMLGAEAVVDPGVLGPVSVELHNVRVRTLLDTVCESLGCRWNLASGTPVKLRVAPLGPPAESPKASGIKEPIDLKVTKADAADLLKTFGQILNADLVIDPEIKGTLTFEIENKPVDQTLDAVCKELGCEWSFMEAANGRKAVLRISSKRR
jgi:type II secretory pathway component GspD/PulD (secretin)